MLEENHISQWHAAITASSIWWNVFGTIWSDLCDCLDFHSLADKRDVSLQRVITNVAPKNCLGPPAPKWEKREIEPYKCNETGISLNRTTWVRLNVCGSLPLRLRMGIGGLFSCGVVCKFFHRRKSYKVEGIKIKVGEAALWNRAWSFQFSKPI